jgi:hypothetical protein
MASAQRHTGGCHCGRVRYEVDTDLAQVIACNCSICSKRGLLLSFVAADKFTLISGDGEQTVYHFNKGAIDHLFCKTCGVASYAEGKKPDGQAMVAINVRCLDGIDLDSLTLTPVDGRSL